jgi:hypothetical protein
VGKEVTIMPFSIRSLWRKLVGCKEISAASPADDGDFAIEELEARRLPAADIWSLAAAQGSATGTADPIVAGQVVGDPIVGLEVEIDRDGDGTIDAAGFVEHGSGDFTVDLRTIDGTLDDFEGTMSVRARAIELDGQGSQVAAGEWVETEFFLFGPRPTLDGFSGSEGAGDVWTFSGTAGGAHAAGATIEFGGLLAGHSVQADSAGNFSLTLSLGDVDGTVTARVIDGYGQESDTAEYYCNSVDDPILISFTGAEASGDVWTFTGSVSGPTSSNATITFGGVLGGQTAQVDSSGSFSLTLQLGDVDGLATAQAFDADGRGSNVVEFYCNSAPDPWSAGSFGGSEGADNYWTFAGSISGASVEGATVTFGGVLAGHSTQLDASGNFTLSAQLGNIDGYATAEVVDPTGQTIHMEAYCTSAADAWQGVSFTGWEEAGDTWTFTGTISGDGVGGATVNLGGVLAGYSAQVDASGNFSISAQLNNINGYATAEVVDPTGQTIHLETYCVSQVDSWQGEWFTGWEESGDTWTFNGYISGEGAAGATVTFGGVLAGYSATIDSAGNFWVTASLGNIDGYATAEVVDPTGQTIHMETYCVSEPDPEPDPLVITAFYGERVEGSEGTWAFTGTVTGTHAAGANISFGGVLAGGSVQADSNGSFSFTLPIPGVSGEATAIAENGGMQSSMAQYYVQA